MTALLGLRSTSLTQRVSVRQPRTVLSFVWILKICTDGQVMVIIGPECVYISSPKQSCEDS